MLRLSVALNSCHITRQRSKTGRSDRVFLSVFGELMNGATLLHTLGLPPWNPGPIPLGSGLRSGMTISMGGPEFTLETVELDRQTSLSLQILGTNHVDGKTFAESVIDAAKTWGKIYKLITQIASLLILIPFVNFVAALAWIASVLVAIVLGIAATIARPFVPPKSDGPVLSRLDSFQEYPLLAGLFMQSSEATFEDSGFAIPKAADSKRGPVYTVRQTITREMTPDWSVGPAITNRDGHLDVFAITEQGSVVTPYWDSAENNGNWNFPFDIAGDGKALPGALAVIGPLRYELTVFWIGVNGEIRHAWWTGEHWLSRAEALTEPRAAAPGSLSAAARHPERLEVFWITDDGQVCTLVKDNREYRKYDPDFEAEIDPPPLYSRISQTWPDLVDEAWHGRWEEVPREVSKKGSALPGALASVGRTPSTVDCFWINRRGQVVYTYWMFKNKTFAEARAISAPDSATPGALAAIARTGQRLDVFWIGLDGSVQTAWWDRDLNGGEWPAPFPIAGPGCAAPGCVAVAARKQYWLDVFWIAPLGSIYQCTWDGSAWQAPRPIFGAEVACAGSIAVVAQNPSHLDIFWVAPGSQLMTAWWDESVGTWSVPSKLADGIASGW
jgi:hypothetical protein